MSAGRSDLKARIVAPVAGKWCLLCYQVRFGNSYVLQAFDD